MARATCTAACGCSPWVAANQAATALTPHNTTAMGYHVADLKVMAPLRRPLPMRVRWGPDELAGIGQLGADAVTGNGGHGRPPGRSWSSIHDVPNLSLSMAKRDAKKVSSIFMKI